MPLVTDATAWLSEAQVTSPTLRSAVVSSLYVAVTASLAVSPVSTSTVVGLIAIAVIASSPSPPQAANENTNTSESTTASADKKCFLNFINIRPLYKNFFNLTVKRTFIIRLWVFRQILSRPQTRYFPPFCFA